MERVADELGVPPLRISFIASLRAIRERWLLAATTDSLGNVPRFLRDLRDEIATFVLPPRRDRTYPRHVKLKMSNYPPQPSERRSYYK
jgi:hypothetical protein